MNSFSATQPDKSTSEATAFEHMEAASLMQPNSLEQNPEPSREEGLSKPHRRLLALYSAESGPNDTIAHTNYSRPLENASMENEGRIPFGLHLAQRPLQTCYERALKRNIFLTKVKAEVKVTIKRSGRVRRVHIKACKDRFLRKCIRKALMRTPFPPQRRQRTFSLPLHFKASAI